jgi:hypothetical protein
MTQQAQPLTWMGERELQQIARELTRIRLQRKTTPQELTNLGKRLMALTRQVRPLMPKANSMPGHFPPR